MEQEISQELLESVDTPMYILSEDRLRANLSLLRHVADVLHVEIILAFKAFALWKTFNIFREYISCTTASSLYEARLAQETFGTPTHTFSPAYAREEVEAIAALSSHLTFNSLSQYNAYHTLARQRNRRLLLGLRINPGFSPVATELYNPCARGSRLGIPRSQMPARLPVDITGLHFHSLCEGSASDLQRTLDIVGDRFDPWLRQVEWLNIGGGHLLTRQGYDINLFLNSVRRFRMRYPLRVILELGSAFAWQTGVLVARVEDIVESDGIRTALLNVSFTCHMPDCLEMPYHPVVRHATTVAHYNRLVGSTIAPMEHVYRLGGNSCLAGDYMDSWQFEKELEVGDKVVFEDMMHYTTVKTTMFNGVQHPSIALLRSDGTLDVLRTFTYDDYKNRMD